MLFFYDRVDITLAVEMSSNNNSPMIPMNEPSLCIPRTFSNITWQKVKEVFEELFGKGTIERVDVVKKTHDNGESFNRVFVHFRKWPSDQANQAIRQRLLDGEEIKIVYDEPWFWKCSKSRVPKPTGERGGARRAPYIDTGASGGGASGGGASGGGASGGGASGSGVRAVNAAARRRVQTELGPSPKHDDMGVNHASSAFASDDTNNGDEAPTTHGGEVADSQKD